MYSAAQVLSLQYTNKPIISKNNYKGKTKTKLLSIEKLDYSRVRVKVNYRPALALMDLQTTGAELINERFVHLFSLPTYSIDKKSLNITIKGSNAAIAKAYDVQMDYGVYTEIRTLTIGHPAGWDMIVGKPGLTALKALILAAPNPFTIQTEGMARFVFKE